MMAWASTVEVVVPSPASSFVFLDASFRSCAPMFSKESSSSISLAMVTPSEHTCGGPNFLSRITFRPLGPSVTFTVSASVSIPCFRRVLASVPKLSCFAGISLPFACLRSHHLLTAILRRRGPSRRSPECRFLGRSDSLCRSPCTRSRRIWSRSPRRQP